ncbi:tyrosine-type recombinase/integrase [Paenibacillus terrigena]|uniref:tyrosine-type recombinase/integrase n=1 Tax=Paenibacillus terrigena TaxID=369333 RepID=UPI000378286F|nr:tyrosine-type recombinase/integrase [Paenibacillus terrigena]
MDINVRKARIEDANDLSELFIAFIGTNFNIEKTIRSALKRLAARGELEVNVYPHHFHHTYACQLLDNGAPFNFIQGMLGHEKTSTTQIYAQLRGERRRELYRRFF